jgi:hypothetical protein
MDQWILMVDGPLQVGVIYHVAAVPADWLRYRVNRVNPDLGTQRPDRGSSVPLASDDSQIGVRMRICLYGQD